MIRLINESIINKKKYFKNYFTISGGSKKFPDEKFHEKTILDIWPEDNEMIKENKDTKATVKVIKSIFDESKELNEVNQDVKNKIKSLDLSLGELFKDIEDSYKKTDVGGEDYFKIKKDLLSLEKSINEYVNKEGTIENEEFTDITIDPDIESDKIISVLKIFINLIEDKFYKNIHSKLSSYKNGEINYRDFYNFINTGLSDTLKDLLTLKINLLKKLEVIESYDFKYLYVSSDDIRFLSKDEIENIYSYVIKIEPNNEDIDILKININACNDLLSFIKHIYVKNSNPSKFIKLDDFSFLNKNKISSLKGGGDITSESSKEVKKHFIKGNLLERDLGFDTLKSLETLHSEIKNFNILIERCNKSLYNFRLKKIQYNYFLMFLLLMTEQMNKKSIIFYQYINKGILVYYLRVIEKILTQIRVENPKYEIKYFFKFYYLMLIYLEDFIKKIVNYLDNYSLIDVFNSKNDVKIGFIILNHFKEILDIFQSKFLNKVTIYSRINDWDKNLRESDKVFKRKENSYQYLLVEKSKNDSLKNQQDDVVKFTEVFDSETFPDNQSITTYMALSTQISKGKGIFLLTYGYSGIGKSYTFFGSQKPLKQGILQSTLTNLPKLERLKLRIYEIYGTGSQYYEFWESDSNKTELHYKYNINLYKGVFNVTGSSIINNFQEYLNNMNDNFLIVENKDILNALKNFNILIDLVDKIRESEKRICITSNNPQSSRSIIVIDFQLLVETPDGLTYVPFVIMDMPGREDVVKTFALDYLNKSFINKSLNTIYHKIIIFSCFFHFYMPICCSGIIFEIFNNLSLEEKKTIVETLMDQVYILSSNKVLEVDKKDKVRFEDEILSININSPDIESGKLLLRSLYNFEDFIWKNNYNFRFEPNRVYNSKNIFSNKKTIVLKVLRNSKQVNVNINPIQYSSILSLHLIGRIVKLGMIDVLDKISKTVFERFFNLDNIKETLKTLEDKKKFVYDNTEINENDENKLNKIINEILYFNPLKPIQGFYINEVINQIIKEISLIVGMDTFKINSSITPKQDPTLRFNHKKVEVREYLYNLYSANINFGLDDFENIFINPEILEGLLKRAKEEYSFKKIFKSENKTIRSIISNYKIQKSVEEKEYDKLININISKITDYKIFYLFSNMKKEKKSVPQIELLEQTKELIKNIVDEYIK